MKWSLFDKKNQTLLTAIIEKYQLTDDYITQAKQSADVSSELARKVAAASPETPQKQTSNNHRSTIKENILKRLNAASKSLNISIYGQGLGIAQVIPNRNYDLYVYRAERDERHGKTRLTRTPVSNSKELSNGDVVIVHPANDSRQQADGARRNYGFIARNHKMAKKKVFDVKKKSTGQLPRAEKLEV